MATMRMIFGISLIVAGIILGVKLVPPYIANYEFQDFLTSEARQASYAQRITEEDIRNEVFKKATELDLPLTKDQIMVQRIGTAGYSSITLSADYTVPIDLLVYKTDLHFSAGSANKPI
jgi:hypothetical protein